MLVDTRLPSLINESDKYIAGVSCPRCFESLTAEQIQRFREREKQVQLAKQRGETHIGLDSRFAADANRIEKQAEKERPKNDPCFP